MRLGFQALSGRDRPSRLGGYALAVAAVALIYGLQLALRPLLGAQSPFLLLIFAVLIAAFYAGRGPATLAAALSGLGGVALVAADGTLLAVEAMRLGVFVLVSLGIVLFVDQAIRARAAAVEMRGRAEASARHLQSILDTVPDAIVAIDGRGLIISFSAAAQAMFGYGEEELMGRNVSMLMPSPDRERHDSYLYRYHKTGERRMIGTSRVVTGLRRDGRAFPMEIKVGEAQSDGRQIFTAFVRDLTDKHRTEARVQELQSELVHVSRLSAMGTMAATLAHELNQPLTAIANYAEAAESIIDSDAAADRALLREIFGEMSGQTMRAGAIVRRLREFIARGEIEKRIENLPELIEEAAALALVGAREQGVTTRIDLDPAATPVLVDRIQIQQVLINLIRNAIEAMEDSELRRLQVASSIEQGGMIRVSVSDSGPGIAPNVGAQLFQAFLSTKSSGMGLGLSICRTIVEAHGGRIRAGESAEGGAEFQFTLPRAAASADEAEEG